MKLTEAQSKNLVAVLNAQSGKGDRLEGEAYKAALADAAPFMNVDDKGKPAGGIKKEVYDANKENKELVEAAKAHVAKAKERSDKAKEKAEKAPAKAESKMRTPEQEQETAAAIVAYCNAVAGVKRITKVVDGKEVNDLESYNSVANKTRKYIDHEKGGLKNTAPEGKTTPWDRFKGFPGVKEACKAHQKAIKEKAKSAPEVQ